VKNADTILNFNNRGYVMDNKKKSTSNGKKEDGSFRSKKIKHDPQAEGARAVFGLQDPNPEKAK
jgi:hypothetical protein